MLSPDEVIAIIRVIGLALIAVIIVKYAVKLAIAALVCKTVFATVARLTEEAVKNKDESIEEEPYSKTIH